MSFWTLALRSLTRRPLRAALAVSGVALAVATFLSLLGLANGNVRAWERSLSGQGTDILVSRKGSIELISTTIAQSLGARLARLPGVRDVSGELIALLSLESGHSVVVSGREPDRYQWAELSLMEGTLPATDGPPGIAIGRGIAEALGLHVGDQLELEGKTLLVSGIVRPSGTLTSYMLFMPIARMQELFDRPGVVTVFCLRLAAGRPEAVAAFIKAHAAEFPELTLGEARTFGKDSPFFETIGALAWAISSVALLAGLVGVLNTLLMSVTERIRELGILSALGWQPARVVALIVLEGLLLSTAGSVVGVSAGYAALRVLAAQPRIAGLLDPEITFGLGVEAILATIILGGLGSFYPAWRAVRLRPVEALKHE
ncbi:MAG: ABC transporter permease [Acidobacteria bacterium]|nr:ABC transporter permease [Acidobacteriota bacterium]